GLELISPLRGEVRSESYKESRASILGVDRLARSFGRIQGRPIRRADQSTFGSAGAAECLSPVLLQTFRSAGAGTIGRCGCWRRPVESGLLPNLYCHNSCGSNSRHFVRVFPSLEFSEQAGSRTGWNPSQPLLSLLLWFQLPPIRKGLSQPGVFRTSRSRTS